MGFVRSRGLNRILNLAKVQGKTPSEVMGIDDEYTAFCFDEACDYLVKRVLKGDDPRYEKKKKKVSSMAEYFKGLGV